MKSNFGYVLTTFLCCGAAAAHAETVPIQILSAVVKDQRIANATVILQKNGATSVAGTTNAQGMVTLSPDYSDGVDSLIIVKKPGYSNLLAKCPCNGMTYALSPTMHNLDGLRIVLNWGSTPPDLDSHLGFPNGQIYFKSKNGDFRQAFSNSHIYWKSKDGKDANLDVDDVDGFGPETITVSRKHSGESYVYAVHDFVNRTNPNSNVLAGSHAKVLVYIGQSLVRSYYVPNQVGNLWTVFRITPEGEFQDINAIQGASLSDPSMVSSIIDSYLDTSTRVEAKNVSTADANSALALNKSGEQAYHAGNIEEAIDLYRQAIDIDPNFGQAYSNLGLAHAKIGHTAEAIWANRKAIALAASPSAATVRASSYYNIARIYEAAGQYSDALQQYQAAKQENANPVYDKAIERVQGFTRH